MSTQDRSSFFLRDFEPSAVRLKRKLRLILTKTLRKKKLTDKNITLTEFVFYVGKSRRRLIAVADVPHCSLPHRGLNALFHQPVFPGVLLR